MEPALALRGGDGGLGGENQEVPLLPGRKLQAGLPALGGAGVSSLAMKKLPECGLPRVREHSESGSLPPRGPGLGCLMLPASDLCKISRILNLVK